MKTLLLNSAGHFLTDAVCAAALFGTIGEENMTVAVVLYNTLAFSTQCAAGLITDGLRRHQALAALGLLMCCAGALLPIRYILKVTLIGLGNSLFHVAGGTVTLKNSGGKVWPLGVFVAPGALGLSIGTLCPETRLYPVAAALLLVGVMLFAAPGRGAWDDSRTGALSHRGREDEPIPWLAVAALLLAVAVRAVGGSCVSFPWQVTPALSIITVLCVAMGKAAGGFLCDRLGAGSLSWASIPLPALLIAFGSCWALPSMAGQLMLNLSMPVTLWLLYRLMPGSPGLAFGLAASALWPGTILGGMIRLTGAAASALTMACFVFGLAAILYADKIRRKNN